jgi:hypothetical protein
MAASSDEEDEVNPTTGKGSCHSTPHYNCEQLLAG